MFPFGHGLSYTAFSVETTGLEGTPTTGAAVTVEVTNTGDRRGGDVVQVYVTPPDGDHDRPLRHLGAFARVELDPGATERVRLELPPRVFSSWLDGAWVVPPGGYQLSVGRSSADHTVVGTVHAS